MRAPPSVCCRRSTLSRTRATRGQSRRARWAPGTIADANDPLKKADRGRVAARRDQRRGVAGEVDSTRPSVDAAPVVGAPAAGRGVGGDLRADD